MLFAEEGKKSEKGPSHKVLVSNAVFIQIQCQSSEGLDRILFLFSCKFG